MSILCATFNKVSASFCSAILFSCYSFSPQNRNKCRRLIALWNVWLNFSNSNQPQLNKSISIFDLFQFLWSNNLISAIFRCSFKIKYAKWRGKKPQNANLVPRMVKHWAVFSALPTPTRGYILSPLIKCDHFDQRQVNEKEGRWKKKFTWGKPKPHTQLWNEMHALKAIYICA